MEKPIIRDEAFLAQKSQPATFMDIAVAQDLLDTLAAHADRCVGLAANMIGVQKCVIAVNIGPTNIAMLNPEIIKHSGKYDGRRLPVAGGRACCSALRKNYGGLSGYAV